MLSLHPEDFERLVKCVIDVESGGDPNAVSCAGAKGLMQLMDATGRETMEWMSLDPADYRPFDPEQNTLLGKTYLTRLLNRFQDLSLALAAYNCGPTRVASLLNEARHEYGGMWTEIDHYIAVIERLPKETRDYVRKVLEGYYGDHDEGCG